MSEYAAFYNKMRFSRTGEKEKIPFPRTIVTEAILSRLFTEVNYKRVIAVRSGRQTLRTSTLNAYIASKLLKKREKREFQVLYISRDKASSYETSLIRQLIEIASGAKLERKEAAATDIKSCVEHLTTKELQSDKVARKLMNMQYDLIICADYEYIRDEDLYYIEERVFDYLKKDGVLFFESAPNPDFRATDFKAAYKLKKYHFDYVDLA